MHEYIGKAVCEIFSPEFFAPGYTILLPKNLARGDDACLAIIAKEGVDPDKVLNSQCTCEPLSPPLAQEDMVLWNHSYMGGVWVALLKSTLADISPEITTNTLVPKFKEMGREFANRITEEYRITTDNLSSVVDGLNSFHSSFLKMGRVRKSQDGFVMITEECPFSGEPPEACHLFQCFYDGLLEEINPEFVMKCSTMMTKGDKTCHWTIRKKEGARREKSKEESSQDDPIKRLTNKFIDGEITAEELEKKLAHLRKLGLVN